MVVALIYEYPSPWVCIIVYDLAKVVGDFFVWVVVMWIMIGIGVRVGVRVGI